MTFTMSPGGIDLETDTRFLVAVARAYRKLHYLISSVAVSALAGKC
jgi:hypothetical protein